MAKQVDLEYGECADSDLTARLRTFRSTLPRFSHHNRSRIGLSHVVRIPGKEPGDNHQLRLGPVGGRFSGSRIHTRCFPPPRARGSGGWS